MKQEPFLDRAVEGLRGRSGALSRRGLELAAADSREFPWRIQPIGVAGVYLQFADRGNHPAVAMVRNGSGQAGWGTAMVQALADLYPGVRVWEATPVRDTGLRFWVRMQDRVGIRLVEYGRGRDLLPPHVARERLADVRDAEELGLIEAPVRHGRADVRPRSWRRRRKALRAARDLRAAWAVENGR